MAQNGDDLKVITGRQDAYRARTRASLLLSAQEVMAEVGLSATIEDLAHHAQVSPATIYNHFESKDQYLKQALEQMWREWIVWAYDGRPPSDNLETMFDVCRKLFRVDQTHTLFGKVLNKTFNDFSFAVDALRPAANQAFRNVAPKGGLELEDFETRLEMWSFCLFGIFQGVFVSKKLTPVEADNALRVSLSIWNISKSQAEKLTSKSINN